MTWDEKVFAPPMVCAPPVRAKFAGPPGSVNPIVLSAVGFVTLMLYPNPVPPFLK